MRKLSYNDKLRMQTLREQGLCEKAVIIFQLPSLFSFWGTPTGALPLDPIWDFCPFSFFLDLPLALASRTLTVFMCKQLA